MRSGIKRKAVHVSNILLLCCSISALDYRKLFDSNVEVSIVSGSTGEEYEMRPKGERDVVLRIGLENELRVDNQVLWQEDFHDSVPIGLALDGSLIYPEAKDFPRGHGENNLSIIAILADGSPLYRNENDDATSQDLDTCGGKFDAHGNYGYYTWPTCWRKFLPATNTLSCQPGYHSQGNELHLCPKGSYCRGCQRIPCHPGTYSDRTGTLECLKCPSGKFCPIGTIIPNPCGDANFYCPGGSSSRYLTTPGYVALPVTAANAVMKSSSLLFGGFDKIAQTPASPGTYAIQGIASLCPEGTYNPSYGQSSCKHSCPSAYFCPEGSFNPAPLPAGRFSAHSGLAAYTQATLCPAGYYCPQASTVPLPLPAGFYSSKIGLGDSTQSTVCPAGYACPTASTQPTECAMAYSALAILLGGEVDIKSKEALYCPVNSAAPSIAGNGYYTLPLAKNNTKYSVAECEPGFYCPGDGRRYLCPAGYYGATWGLSDCKQKCAPGHYCDAGSTTATQHVCGGSNLYCPPGSSRPLQVGTGNYSTTSYVTIDTSDVLPIPAAQNNAQTSSPDRRAGQKICEPGFYCLPDGIRRPCPAGTYGTSWGLSDSACDGQSPSGMYAPAGSTEAVPVDAGYYCRDGGCSSAKGQGQCWPGYYCPAGSTSPTMRPCCDARKDAVTGLTFKYNSSLTVDLISLVTRDSNFAPGVAHDVPDWHLSDVYAPRCEFLYCPQGSSKPRIVDSGSFTVGGNRTTRTGQRRCGSSETRPLLFDDQRRSYCPFSTRPSNDDSLLGPTRLTSIDLSARPAFAAWQTPLFMGLPGPYEWPPTPTLNDVLSSDDTSSLNKLLLYRDTVRLQSTDSFLYLP